MLEAADLARSAGRTVAFTLSESLCIGDRRDGVRGMVESGTVDILFGNEDEVRHLTGCTALSDCITALSGQVATLVITRGPYGALGVEKDSMVEVPAFPVERIIDTTGAGDQYAAGFLLGLARGLTLEEAGKLGSLAASEVIAHWGPRPMVKLEDLAAGHGLKL